MRCWSRPCCWHLLAPFSWQAPAPCSTCHVTGATLITHYTFLCYPLQIHTWRSIVLDMHAMLLYLQVCKTCHQQQPTPARHSSHRQRSRTPASAAPCSCSQRMQSTLQPPRPGWKAGLLPQATRPLEQPSHWHMAMRLLRTHGICSQMVWLMTVRRVWSLWQSS